MDNERYARNKNTISNEENEFLSGCRVCVVGCGGLGGYVIQLLGRLGVGHITAVDGDVFELSNLNRQLFSDETVIGRKKAEVAREKMRDINSLIEVAPICKRLNAENGGEIIKDHNVVVDALDNVPSRRILADLCRENNIPLVHGAIAGWMGQLTVIMPGDKAFDVLYPVSIDRGVETVTGTPSFTPAAVAALQAGEVVKILLKKDGILRGKLLTIDILNNRYELFDI